MFLCCSKGLCTARIFGLMENPSPPGRVLPPAPLTGGTKSLLSCRNSRTCSRCLSHCGASRQWPLLGEGPAHAPTAALLLLGGLQGIGSLSRCCPRHPGASQEPVSAPLPGEGVRAARAEATKSQGGQSSGLRVPCPAPRAPNQPLGLNTPEPLKTHSFPSSFTYVNDDPQEVIVGERRELASLDLLNHFITGTRSEWPLSAGSASPSPSAFI